MNDPMRFEVRNAEAEALLKEIGSRFKEVVPAGFGFAFMLFEFGEKGSMFYTSNAQREDMIQAMREFIEKFREH